MQEKENQSYPELDLQQFEKKFSKEWLADQPRFTYREIEIMDFILKQSDYLEKQIEKLQEQADHHFVLSGGYPFKFILFLVCGWFLLQHLYPMHWFIGLSVSMFFAILSLWMIISTDRKAFQQLKESNMIQIDDLTNQHQILQIKKNTIEKIMGKTINLELIDNALEELELWQRHSNEREILHSLQSKIPKK